MGRTIGSAVLGYIVIFVSIMVTFSIAFLLMGADRAYVAGTFEVTGFWIVVSLILSFASAVGGGLATVAVDGGVNGARLLIGIVVVLGLVYAIPAFLADPVVTVRGASVGIWESMQNAQQPPWVAVANPLVGVLGILLAVRIGRRQSAG